MNKAFMPFPTLYKALGLERLARYLRCDRLDLLVGIALALLAAVATYGCAQLIGPNLFVIDPYGDSWFDSDVAAYYSTLADQRNIDLHKRTYKHPLLSFALCLPVYLLRAINFDAIIAVRLVVAGIAAIWLASLFCFLRVMGCRLIEAVLLSLIASVSAAALFWLPVLESFALGSLGFVWALGWVAIAQTRPPSVLSGVLISLATWSITITNWFVGLVAIALIYGRRQAIRVTGLALLIGMALVGVQRAVFGSYLPFVVPSNELKYVVSSEAGGPWNVIRAFVCHTLVMPAIEIAAQPSKGVPVMTIQFSSPGTGSSLGALAIGLWLALLALGLWQLLTMKTHVKLRLMLGISLLGQLGLHLVYTGRETFLYSLHFLPFWMGIAALGALNLKRSSYSRPLYIALLIALLITMGLNNTTQFARASAFYHGPPSIESVEQTSLVIKPSSHF